MYRLSQRFFRLKSFSYCRCCYIVAFSPKEFFKIHGVHFKLIFFRWNKNIFYISFYRNNGTSFNIVIASVSYQVFNGLPRFWEELNLVKNYDRVSFRKDFALQQEEVSEKVVQVAYIVFKVRFYFLTLFGKVQNNVILVFVLGKFLRNGALAYSSGTFKQKRGFTVGKSLPLFHFIIDLSLKYHNIWLLFKLSLSYLYEIFNCFIHVLHEFPKSYLMIFHEFPKSLNIRTSFLIRKSVSPPELQRKFQPQELQATLHQYPKAQGRQ